MITLRYDYDALYTAIYIDLLELVQGATEVVLSDGSRRIPTLH